jgi:hypothetical protein
MGEAKESFSKDMSEMGGAIKEFGQESGISSAASKTGNTIYYGAAFAGAAVNSKIDEHEQLAEAKRKAAEAATAAK